MKVLLVGNYQPDQQESMQRFAKLMFSELQRAGCTVKLVQPEPIVNRINVLPAGCSKWLGYIDKFVCFGPALKYHAKWADIIHICDHSNAHYVQHLGVKPHLVTCHDVLAIRSARGEVPENSVGWSGKRLQQIILNGLTLAKHIVCISAHTKSELQDVCPSCPAEIKVIHLSLNHPYTPLPLPEALSQVGSLLQHTVDSDKAHQILEQLQNRGFILHVGGNQWYKNRLGVLRIYSHLCGLVHDAPLLVMVGKPLSSEMAQYVEENNLRNLVISLHDTSNEDLQALYSAAGCLLFPSLSEGFGWPILEAQACGCPVVTSNRAPMTEIGGESVTYINPDDEVETARCVMSLLNEPSEERRARSDAGIAHLSKFSVEQMMQQYLQYYCEIVSREGRAVT